jgi:predicted ATP-dependent endonuclease of OLD family
MRIHSFRIRNFRRLRDVGIDLDKETTIFVGSNNSGKTSATQVFQAFFGADGERGGFSVYDFSAECWGLFDRIGAGDQPFQGHFPRDFANNCAVDTCGLSTC